MAIQILSRSLSLAALRLIRATCWNVLRSLACLIAVLLCSISARTQFRQPFVFAIDTSGTGPGIVVYTRNDISGVLTPVPNSPFPSREPLNGLALDFKGRFLFAATSLNKIEMFTVDPNTGALQEVPNSPFASPTTNPKFLSTESSGQFLYVIDFSSSSSPDNSLVESFQIDAVNLDLIPTPAGATTLPGLFVGGATHPSGKAFYVFCNSPNSPIPNAPSFLLFNSSNGTFTTPNILPLGIGGARSLALDPQGLHVAVGLGQTVTSQELLSDGTLGSSNVSISVNGSPESMVLDTLGQFLYVSLYNNIASDIVHLYSATLLQELPNSPVAQSLPAFTTWIVDPTAPLIYADNVYHVDPQTGLLNSILSPSPLPPPFLQSAVFSTPPGSQPIVGPTALLGATSLSFGSLSLGQTSGTQTLTILSNGGQALALNSLSITGVNPGDFSITTTTCQVPGALPPGQSCSVLVSFTPSLAGARSAALTITDNASPPTESAQLNGTGLTPAPAVTLMPGSLNFGTVTQGTSTPLNISLKNSGNAALHISSVAVGGANANDFSSSSPACNAAIPANSTCTITVTFTPLAPGVRTTTVTITDDAPDSPQTVQLQGNATPAFTPGPAPSGSTTVSVSAGQTAQFQLQLTPGPGYSGTISLACSGAPLNAICQVPGTVTIANGVPAPFTVAVSTAGAAALPPSMPWRFVPLPRIRVVPLLAIALLLLIISWNHWKFRAALRAKQFAWSRALAAILLCSAVYAAGCGSTAVTTTPPPVITPSGTSTITVTLSAMSPTQQPLQLAPIQLTLTVK